MTKSSKSYRAAAENVHADVLYTPFEAMKLANKIAKGPLNCYSSSKLILNKSFETNLEDLLKEETEAQAAARLHPNGDEGLAAFLEKRKANFQ